MAKRRTTNTSKALGDILSERGLTQYGLAKLTNSSQPYVNKVATGDKVPSPQWVTTASNAMNLTGQQTLRLHRAAARDYGLIVEEIDLTETKLP